MESAEGTLERSSESVVLTPSMEPTPTPPLLVRKPWQTSFAPTFIGVFLWLIYFDQIGRRALPSGGLLWCVMGAAAGGLLCYLLLYYSTAMWGQKTGYATSVLSTSTFGIRGGRWLSHGCLGIAQIVWMAVSAHYATDWSLQGLVSLGLLSAQYLQPITVGSMTFPGFLFLITSLSWLYAAAMVGNYLPRVIIALMNVYPIFPAISLAVVTLFSFRGLAGAALGEGGQAIAATPASQGPEAFMTIVQWVFGYFACASVTVADWGAVSRSPRDVRIGGLVGVFLSSWVVATLALLVVVGTFGNETIAAQPNGAIQAIDATFRNALLIGMPAWLAGVTFLLFGLSALAPACFGAQVLGHNLSTLNPRWRKLRWILLATPIAWLALVFKMPLYLEQIYAIMGTIFAPMMGALAADYFRSRGEWRGARRGLNPPGIIAWGLGAIVGALPLVGYALEISGLRRFQPAAVVSFVVAYLAFLLLAKLGLESALSDTPRPVPAVEMPQAVGDVVSNGSIHNN